MILRLISLLCSAAEMLLTNYSLLPLHLSKRLPFQALAFDPYTHIPHDPSHSELAGLSAKGLELMLAILSKEACDLLYFPF
jgi:hypothetical protein